MPGGVVGHLQRSLGGGGQQGSLRTRALPRGVQPSRSDRRDAVPGHHHPEGATGHGRARRHPGDGRARAQPLPGCVEPLPLPRRGQAVAAVRRRDRARGARREDRVRPDRLRRRPRQHRPRRAHPRDDGHRAEEVAGLQRAGPPVGVHPGALSRRRTRCRDEPADGHRHDQHHDGGPRESAAGAYQRVVATAHRRRTRPRPGDPGQPRAHHRRRLRHHHRTHRALARVAVGPSGPARVAQPGTRHPAQPRHRGVPALLHARAG